MVPVVALVVVPPAHACVRYLDEGRQRSLSDGKVGSCVSPGQFPSPSPTARPRRERASIGFLVPFFWFNCLFSASEWRFSVTTRVTL